MTELTKETAEHLAAVIAAVRPDWETRGTVKALADLRDRPIAETTIAAVLAALNPDARTPAVIPLSGEHWIRAQKAIDPDGDRTPASVHAGDLCAVCSRSKRHCDARVRIDGDDSDNHVFTSARDAAIARAQAERRAAEAAVGKPWSPTAALERGGRMPPELKNPTVADVRAKNQRVAEREAAAASEHEGATT